MTTIQGRQAAPPREQIARIRRCRSAASHAKRWPVAPAGAADAPCGSGIGQPRRIVCDQRIALVVQRLDQFGEQMCGRSVAHGSVAPGRSDRRQHARRPPVSVRRNSGPCPMTSCMAASERSSMPSQMSTGGDSHPCQRAILGAGNGRGRQAGQRTDPVDAAGLREAGSFSWAHRRGRCAGVRHCGRRSLVTRCGKSAIPRFGRHRPTTSASASRGSRGVFLNRLRSALRRPRVRHYHPASTPRVAFSAARRGRLGRAGRDVGRPRAGAGRSARGRPAGTVAALPRSAFTAAPGLAYFEDCPDAILRFNAERRVVYANPAVERATAVSRWQFIEHRLEDVEHFVDFAPLWNE